MSIMTVTTQLTHKSLMAKSKRELVDLVLMYADTPDPSDSHDSSNLTNILEDEVIFLRTENESLNEINKTLQERLKLYEQSENSL